MTDDNNPYRAPRTVTEPAATHNRPYSIIVGISIALFAVSLAGDGFYLAQDNPRDLARGYLIFLMGWTGMFVGVFYWFANPPLLASWLMFSYERTRAFAVVPALVALGVALSFLWCREFPIGTSGDYTRITGYGLGYWLWIASIATMAVSTLAVSLASLFSGVWRSSTTQTERRRSGPRPR